MDKNETLEAKDLKKSFEGESRNVFRQKARIIHDGKQFSIKIPAKIAATLGIDVEKDCFEFVVTKPEDVREETKLEGKLTQW